MQHPDPVPHQPIGGGWHVKMAAVGPTTCTDTTEGHR